jgi:hypothetical protein
MNTECVNVCAPRRESFLWYRPLVRNKDHVVVVAISAHQSLHEIAVSVDVNLWWLKEEDDMDMDAIGE